MFRSSCGKALSVHPVGYIVVGSLCVPSLWCGIIDYTRPIDDRLSIPRSLWQLPRELSDDWFRDAIIELVGSEENLDSDELLAAIRACAWEVLLKNGQSEY